jgi:hypothetical protein
MPLDIQPSFDAADFNDAFFLDWLDHPQRGALTAPCAVTKTLRDYRFEECDITVDIGGPPVGLSVCSVDAFNFNFESGDGVLLGDNMAGKLPVHLFFNPPLRAMGSHVSASGPVNSDYLAQLSVRLDDGEWHSQSRQGRLSRSRGSAPFMGAITTNGKRITEAWFDVVDPLNRNDFFRVAINHFYFQP